MNTYVNENIIKKLENPKYEYKCGIPVKWKISQCDFTRCAKTKHYVVLTCTTTSTDQAPEYKDGKGVTWYPVADKEYNVYWHTQIRNEWDVSCTNPKKPDFAFYNCINRAFKNLMNDESIEDNTENMDIFGQLALATFHAISEENYLAYCGYHLMDIWDFLWNWGYDDTYEHAKEVSAKIGSHINKYLFSNGMKEKIVQIIKRICKPLKSIVNLSDVILPEHNMGSNAIGFIGWTKEDIIKLGKSIHCDTTDYIDIISKELNTLYHSVGVQFDIQLIIANACKDLNLYIENPIVDKKQGTLSPFSKEDFMSVNGLTDNEKDVKYGKIHSIIGAGTEITVDCRINTKTKEIFDIVNKKALKGKNNNCAYITIDNESGKFPINEKYKANESEFWYSNA